MPRLPAPVRSTLAVLTISLAAMAALPTAHATPEGYRMVETDHAFGTLVERLRAAIQDAGMFAVTTASASDGAAMRGLDIPGDRIIGVYRNDFAVRMLDASPAAGIEAPIRFHITEGTDGTAALRWIEPSAVFAPYDGGDALQAMAAELDVIFADIAEAAAKSD